MNAAWRAVFAVTLGLPLACAAASFDCGRARSKLNRTICADAELSRIDRVVWDTYGERIRTLAPLSYLHVRERHLQWRRSRGLYEMSVEALLHDYRSHLAWLTHPLLGAEGRYQRPGLGLAAGGARLEVELDLRSPGALAMRGLVTLPSAIAWHGSAAADDATTGAAPQQLRVRPLVPGSAALLAPDCSFAFTFSGDEARLEHAGNCGADFSGRYVRILHD